MAFAGKSGKLKYEFLVRPGARIRDIRLAYTGAKQLSLDRGGNLRIGTALGTIGDSRPISYQGLDGRRVPVASRFRSGPLAARYGFAVGAYDRRRPLVIDPGLLYSTYLGGSGDDDGYGIAVDGGGQRLRHGPHRLDGLPDHGGAFDTSYNGGTRDAFVTKLNAAGSALAYSTYLGGSECRRRLGDRGRRRGQRLRHGRHDLDGLPDDGGAFDTSCQRRRATRS